YEWKGGLQKLANEYGINRVGTMHQAGSDSLVTAEVFFRVVNKLKSRIDVVSNKDTFDGHIYGLHVSYQDNSFQ
ncbi:hypothetical protein KIPB_009729, partial [Kipferlia bialata]